PTLILIVFFMRVPHGVEASLRPRPIFETAAETVARFRTVNVSINKGDSKKRQLRKVPAPTYVFSARSARTSRGSGSENCGRQILFWDHGPTQRRLSPGKSGGSGRGNSGPASLPALQKRF
ncbi:MAG TPA: hypothetical protein VMJ31_06975, partial [Methylocystis sp.]|nr:hypothetical protein [Methylocystis sp.]